MNQQPKIKIKLQEKKDNFKFPRFMKKGSIDTKVIQTADNVATSAGYFHFSAPYIILNPAFLYSSSLNHEMEIK